MPQNYIFESNLVAIKPCKYGPMMYLKNDLYIGRSLDVYGEWCDHEIQLLRQFLSPGDIVVDVGANIGTHTVPLAQAVTSAGQVLAFEPQRLLHTVLTANMALNDLLQVQCLPLAAGSVAGFVNIPFFNPAVPDNFGNLNAYGPQAGDPVKVIALDDLSLPKCRLIKIDVEGGEAAVLLGAQQTIARCRPVLFVENNSVGNAANLNAMILGQNYACYWFFCPYFNPDNHFHHSSNLFESNAPEANLICVPKEQAVHISLEPLLHADDNYVAAYDRIRLRQ